MSHGDEERASTVNEFPRGERFAFVSYSVVDDLDTPFTRSVSARGSRRVIVRLCRVADDGSVPCVGAR